MSKPKRRPDEPATPPAFTPEPGRERWEYRRELLSEAATDWPDAVNRLGADGWELVAVIPERHRVRYNRREMVEGAAYQSDCMVGHYAVFKRKVVIA